MRKNFNLNSRREKMKAATLKAHVPGASHFLPDQISRVWVMDLLVQLEGRYLWALDSFTFLQSKSSLSDMPPQLKALQLQLQTVDRWAGAFPSNGISWCCHWRTVLGLSIGATNTEISITKRSSSNWADPLKWKGAKGVNECHGSAAVL